MTRPRAVDIVSRNKEPGKAVGVGVGSKDANFKYFSFSKNNDLNVCLG